MNPLRKLLLVLYLGFFIAAPVFAKPEAGAGGAQGGGKGEDVVDADYEVVDEEGKEKKK